jgi:predicted unusual protein kinase regulating ubiquinone biosynthesis (AarF/ABC1/UbiB family)
MKQLAPSERLLRTILHKQEAGTLFGELSRRFVEEADYRLEAERQKEFARLFADHPVLRVPEVFDDRSSDRVLTSRFAEGMTVDTFRRSVSREERDRAGTALWEFFHVSIFRHGLFPTDPHPGNFLFGGGHVTCLDFGRIQRLSPGFAAKWRAVMRAAIERDAEALREAHCAIDHVPDPSNFDFENARRATLIFYLPWLKDEPFEFTPDLLRQKWRVLAPENTNVARLNYPADMAFMTQLYFGLSALLVRLGAHVRCRDVVLDVLYAPGEERPLPFSDAEVAALLGTG